MDPMFETLEAYYASLPNEHKDRLIRRLRKYSTPGWPMTFADQVRLGMELPGPTRVLTEPERKIQERHAAAYAAREAAHVAWRTAAAELAKSSRDPKHAAESERLKNAAADRWAEFEAAGVAEVAARPHNVGRQRRFLPIVRNVLRFGGGR